MTSLSGRAGSAARCLGFRRKRHQAGTRGDVELFRQRLLHNVHDGVLDEVLTDAAELGQPAHVLRTLSCDPV